MTALGYVGVALIGCGILQIVTFPLWVWFGQRTTRGTAFPWEEARHRSRAEVHRDMVLGILSLLAIGAGFVVAGIWEA